MKAGWFSAELEGADLTQLRWGGLEIASSIQVTVRDERWGTLRPALVTAEVSEDADRFSVSLEATHGDDVLAWTGTIHASADGTLGFDVNAIAKREFVYRRMGICVQHPWASHVGARYEASGVGTAATGTFPSDIAPQPLVDGHLAPFVPAFKELSIRFPTGVDAGYVFEGEDDGFELEDQRNWTDASFKTYPTPLKRSLPRRLQPAIGGPRGYGSPSEDPLRGRRPPMGR